MDIVYYAASSLDSYIATPDGGVDWLSPYQNRGEDYGFAEFYASVDALVMGSHSYEVGLTHGPWRAKDKPSWVLTSRDLEVPHASITLTNQDPANVVHTMEQRGVRRAWLMGGGKLASSFRTAGLLSHYMIAIIPVVLGAGIPLFADAPHEETLQLAALERYESGIVMLSYERTAA